jgi:adenylate cyclase
MPVSQSKSDAMTTWLLEHGRMETDRRRFVYGLAGKLREAGVPVDRVSVSVLILHPQVDATSVIWEVGEDEAVEDSFRRTAADLETFEASPLRVTFATGQDVQCRIPVHPAEDEFGIFPHLRDAGIVDYFNLAIPFSDGTHKAISFATRTGFDPSDLDLLRRLRPILSLIIELQTSQRTARTLLCTYLGEGTGQRVLDGQVRRGDAENIHAVIWFSDLRGSTPLAQSMNARDFMALLNQYLECMAAAVLGQGGEVLRFIGDAALGIFPISEDSPVSGACLSAVQAAEDAIGRMVALNATRIEAGEPAVEFGVGLHLGHVLYGNIGTDNRLEFTVVGHAANEAARIEGMCKSLGERLLLSASVAEHLPDRVVDLGTHNLRGVGGAARLFTLSSE